MLLPETDGNRKWWCHEAVAMVTEAFEARRLPWRREMVAVAVAMGLKSKKDGYDRGRDVWEEEPWALGQKMFKVRA